MHRPQAILQVLYGDLGWLLLFSAYTSLLMIVPALVVGFVAAARVEPTRCIDWPKGTFRAWLAGVLTATIVTPVVWGLFGFVDQVFRPQLGQIAEFVGIGIIGFIFILCVAAQYRTAELYFKWKRNDLRGWKIHDEPSQPANRWYSFSLKNLLLAQLTAIFLFGLWISVRRQDIESHYQFQQIQTWRPEVRSRLAEHGWDMHDPFKPLWLRSDDRPLIDFDDSVLDKVLVTDQLKAIELVSDKLTDAGLARLIKHQQLRNVKIKSDQVTDSGIAHLRQLAAVQDVHLDCERLTDKVLDDLAQIPSLKFVYIEKPLISRAAAKAFRAARPDVSLNSFHRD